MHIGTRIIHEDMTSKRKEKVLFLIKSDDGGGGGRAG